MLSLSTLGLLALVAGALQFRQATLVSLRTGLSEALGVRVQIGNMHAWLPNRVVVQDIRIGDLISIPQAELHLRLNGSLRPKVEKLILLRPTLNIRFTEDMVPPTKPLARPLANRVQRAGAGFAQLPRERAIGRWLRRLQHLEIRDGSADLEVTWRDQIMRATSQGIYLRAPRNPGASSAGDLRLVTGRTTITSNAGHRMAASAAAVDVELGSSMPRVVRIASLDNRVNSPYLSQEVLVRSILLDRRFGDLGGQIHIASAGHTHALSLSFLLDPKFRPIRARMVAKRFDTAPIAGILGRLGMTGTTTRISGHAQAELRNGRIRVSSDLRGEAVRLSVAAIAKREIGPFDVIAKTDLSLQPEKGLFEVHDLELKTGSLIASLNGRLQLGQGGPQLSMQVEVPQLGCQNALRSLPFGLAPQLQGMALTGQLGFKGKFALDDDTPEATQISVALSPNTCRVVADPPLANVKMLARPFSLNARGPKGTPLPWRLGPSNPYWRPLSKTSRHLQAAIVAAEDNRFYSHQGFDAKQLKRAFIMNVTARKILRGASTISQQLVKNVFLSHRRTLSRKLQETILTWRMEQVITKPRILELYLNLIEMGPGMFGVEQGAQHYFGHSAGKLSPLQAAHIASVTPSPRPLARRFRRAAPDAAWRDKLRLILRLMRRAGKLTRDDQRRWAATKLNLITSPVR